MELFDGIPLLTRKTPVSATSSQASSSSSVSLYKQNLPCVCTQWIPSTTKPRCASARARALTLNFPTNLSSLVPSSSLAFPLNSSYVFTQSSNCSNSLSSSLLYSYGETVSIIPWNSSDIFNGQYELSLRLSFENFIYFFLFLPSTSSFFSSAF